MKRATFPIHLFQLAIFVTAAGLFSLPLRAQASLAKPYQVEWVYRVKYGGQDEWWQIFKKYQISTLDREKELGYVLNYTVTKPSLHTSEENRWDYRIIINYKDQASATHGEEIEHQLFLDASVRQREEARRWELTANHWDLPIHEIDPHQGN